jgi:TctA family transporter
MAICMWIIPAFILKNHIVWGLIAGFCIASALILLTQKVWKPWLAKGDNSNINIPR